MADYIQFVRVELAGIRTLLAKTEPLGPCKDKKKHSWKYMTGVLSGDGRSCAKCGIKFRRPKRLAKQSLHELKWREVRLSELLAEREQLDKRSKRKKAN